MMLTLVPSGLSTCNLRDATLRNINPSHNPRPSRSQATLTGSRGSAMWPAALVWETWKKESMELKGQNAP